MSPKWNKARIITHLNVLVVTIGAKLSRYSMSVTWEHPNTDILALNTSFYFFFNTHLDPIKYLSDGMC